MRDISLKNSLENFKEIKSNKTKRIRNIWLMIQFGSQVLKLTFLSIKKRCFKKDKMMVLFMHNKTHLKQFLNF
jgi:hypothetical protein